MFINTHDIKKIDESKNIVLRSKTFLVFLQNCGIFLLLLYNRIIMKNDRENECVT